jgi:IS1 family transposase
MNKKSTKDRAQILRCLVEGNSIRSTVRLTGASKNTITKLLVEIGEACANYHDKHVKGVRCKRVQVDEIWSFVYSKQKNTPQCKKDSGDVWTWTGLCAESKLILSYCVGNRDSETATSFMKDLAARLANKVQLTSDGHKPYLQAVEKSFGNKVNYGMLVKIYGNPDKTNFGAGSCCIGAQQKVITGKPKYKHISTSFIERSNLTMRMGMRRFTRSTNAFSKKIENHIWAISLHFMYYNFCRVHQSLKTTPAKASKLTDKIWTLEDIIEMSDNYWLAKGKSN